MLVAVDCVIFGFDPTGIKLLVFQRKVQPFFGHWSLIGSFVQPKEDVRTAAIRIVEESTGLTDVYLEELGCYGQVDRDPGARVVSIVHYALLRIDEYKLSPVEDYQARWFDFEDLPDLIFDHQKMVKDAMNKLRKKSRYRPIGFELLPAQFTIPQLKKLYDAIYQKELDRRNFRKKILSMKILNKLNIKDRSSSKKGAYLYEFNKENYEQLLQEGIDFKL